MFDAFSQVVQAELERLAQNQRWLAKQLGISHVSVSNWLSNKRRPTMQNIEAVARAFGRNASWLFEQMEQVSPSSLAVPVDPDAAKRDAWDAAWDLAAEIPASEPVKVKPHPFSDNEVTRELDATAVDASAKCPTCGRTGEAA